MSVYQKLNYIIVVSYNLFFRNSFGHTLAKLTWQKIKIKRNEAIRYCRAVLEKKSFFFLSGKLVFPYLGTLYNSIRYVWCQRDLAKLEIRTTSLNMCLFQFHLCRIKYIYNRQIYWYIIIHRYRYGYGYGYGYGCIHKNVGSLMCDVNLG